MFHDAVLHRRGGSLAIDWNAGGVLDIPVTWCRDIRVDAADGGGTQFVLRFAPPQPAHLPGEDTTLIIVRLHTDRAGSFRVREFTELLRRELGLAREPGQPPPDGSGERPSGMAPPRGHPSRLRQVSQGDPDWLISRPGEATQALYNAVLGRAQTTAGEAEQG